MEEQSNTKKELPSRSTRGKKMSALLDDEAEAADNDFWSQAFFQEEMEDTAYISEEEEEDVVDADFDEPEVVDQDDDGEDSLEHETKKRKLNVYVDPKGRDAKVKEKKKKEKQHKKKEAKSTTEVSNVESIDDATSPTKDNEIKSEENDNPTTPISGGKRGKRTPQTDRTVRSSTSNLTKERNAEREKVLKKQQQRKVERQKRKSLVQKVRLTQEELLEESKYTAEYNVASLAVLQQIEEERKKIPSTRPKLMGPLISFRSKDGVDTITFTEVASVPSEINQKPIEYPTRAVCAVTGLPARYVDPKTGTPYATIEAFKSIREQFLKDEQAKYDERLSKLNALLEEKRKLKDELNQNKKKAEEENQKNLQQIPIAPSNSQEQMMVIQ